MIFRLKNKEYGTIKTVQGLDSSALVQPTDQHIDEVKSFDLVYYQPNNLVIEILPEENEEGISGEQITFETSNDGSILPINGNAWWKNSNDPSLLPKRSRYIKLGGERNSAGGLASIGLNLFEPVALYNDKKTLEIKLTENTIQSVNQAFVSNSRPPGGFLTFGVRMLYSVGVKFTAYFMIKYVTSPPVEISTQPPTVELTPENAAAEIWYEPVPLTYETFYVPQISASFVYNFYEINERNYNVAQERNFKGRDLREIPKYVLLEWDKLPNFEISNLPPPPKEAVEGVKQTDVGTNLGDGDIVDFEEIQLPGFGAEQAREFVNERARETAEEDDVGIKIEKEQNEPVVNTSTGFFNGLFFSGVDDYQKSGIIQTAAENTKQETEQAYPSGDFNFGSLGNGSILDEGAGGVNVEDSPDPNFEADDESSNILANEEAFEQDQFSVGRRENLIERNSLYPDDFGATLAQREYIGYVITKKRIANERAVPEVVDVIIVPNKDATRYVDYKVAYGERYIYTIRSVFKYVNTRNLSLYLDSDSVFDTYQSAEFFESGIPIYGVFYFDSQKSNRAEIETAEFVRPNNPINLRIYPNSVKRHIFISWNQKQQNKDVVGFNVYRKLKEENIFKKLNSDFVPLRNNFYLDKEVDFENEYIYAIEAVDYHGNVSTLSVQYIVSLEPQNVRAPQRCEKDIKLHRHAGLELFETTLPQKREIIKFNDSFKFTVNPLFKNFDQETNFLLKVKSLDLNKEKELKIKFKTRIINNTKKKDNKENEEREIPFDESGRVLQAGESGKIIDDDSIPSILNYIGKNRK